MTELGNFLQEQRKEQGLSLDELQTKTKIQKRYLQAIEEGNYGVLPGPFYVRAFIKQYVEALHLSYDEIAEQYKQDIPEAEKEPTEFVPRSERDKQNDQQGSAALAQWLPKLLIIAGIIVIGVIVYFLYVKLGSDDGNSAPHNTTNHAEVEQSKDFKAQDKKKDQKQQEDKQEQKDKKKDTSGKLVKKGTEGIVTTYDFTKGKSLVVGFKMTGPVYLEITTGQKKTVKTYKKGDSVEFDVSKDKEVSINIGATNNAKMTINDQAFSYPLPSVNSGIHQRIVINNNTAGN
ncbi:hypothetical protein A374_12650 [Fictibacillus macauensis ZFHKF-1]|uniref:HTH cro/C1-type domain-containing protein n=1 Tax=Fictibacillus macauensis ZFHKF-1 TaxID=1196324 RepID=I8UEB8_9BACL|nr:RodZ domain-containing protein [Fictibacillus macauensis]EIT85148.1 hypothetical protein A374_12650 [Fictibacillus macauensis ZFHKF-1]